MDLFTPVRLGRYELANRIAMAPLTRNRSPGNVPGDLVRTYYEQRASAALIVTEGIAPEAMGQGYLDVPGLYTAEQVAAWREVTAAVHARGGRIFAQLMHTGRISHPSFRDGEIPLAPSAVRPAGYTRTAEGRADFVTPRPLDRNQIDAIVASYANAARNAVEAGFDGVEIHGANGYLPHQFLSTNANRRTDRYGGSDANRARFLLEAVAAAADAIGADRVGVRISPGNAFNDIFEADPQALYAYVAEALGKLDLAYLHVVRMAEGFDPGPLVRSHYPGTLIINTGYDHASATQALRQGEGDLVSFGQLFIANPDLPERFRLGAPLNPPDPSTFYGGDHRGYTDYPALRLAEAA